MPEPATVIDMTDRLPALPARVGPEAAAPPTPPRVGDRTTILAGLTLIGVFLVGFLAWAALAPLDSAAVAQGRISVEGNVKTVSHLEGGIARDILVTEGATVAAGAVLIRLDDTKARAALELVRGREIAALATEARLVAERDGQAEIAFPSRLLGELADAKVRQAIVGQASIFAARRGELEQQTAIFDKRVAVLQEEIAGLEGEIKAANRQLELLREELADQEEPRASPASRPSSRFAAAPPRSRARAAATPARSPAPASRSARRACASPSSRPRGPRRSSRRSARCSRS
jgi:multidrug efflux pump subunit AcrA (membrane-fusion protein)